MNVLNAKRGRVKTTITNIGKYVATLNQHSLIEDIKIRIDKLEAAMTEFYAIIDQINERADEEDFVDQTKEVEEIETKYYEYSSKLKHELTDYNDDSVAGANMEQLIANQSTFLDKLADINTRPIDINLPKISIPLFDGDRTKWKTFSDYFTSTIHRNQRLSNVQKFHYLRSSMVRNSEAERLIQHIPVTDANYVEAWNKLSTRYDVKTQIVTSFIKSFMEQPTISRHSGSSIRQLCDKSDETIRGLRALGEEAEHRDNWLVYIITNKLDPETRRQWCYENADVEFPSFAQLIEFLNKVANALEINQTERTPKPIENKSGKSLKIHHASNFSSCPICQGDHRIYSCDVFRSMDENDRKSRVVNSKLCFNCLSDGHAFRNCKSRSTCRVCSKKHHSLLHSSNSPQPNSQFAITEVFEDVKTSETALEGCSSSKASEKTAFTANMVVSPSKSFNAAYEFTQSILPTAIVKVKTSSGECFNARALLDSGSEVSFVTYSFFRKLGINRNPSNQVVTGLAQTAIGTTKGTCTLQITLNADSSFKINTFILPKLTGRIPSNPVDVNLQFASNLTLADPEFMTPKPIDILIGVDYFFDVMLSGKISNQNGHPIAQESIFGWVICGKTFTSTNQINHSSLNMCLEQNIDHTLQRFWEIENVAVPKSTLSPDEEAAESHFRNNFTRNDSGRYTVRLPFKTVPVLGNSMQNAIKRLQHMERKFKKDESLRIAYVNFMEEYLTLNHMERVPVDEMQSSEHFYLPHHAVIKESSSTTKLRVVFDASCKSDNGQSLNDVLHIGPQLQDDIFTLIVRFRCHRYAFTADAEKMFRQVQIHSDDRNFQRIVWRNNSYDEVNHYRLTTVTYGTGPGSYLAIRSMQQLAHDEGCHYSRAAKIVLHDFYVDDMMSGTETEEEAVEIFNEIVQLMAKGGFNMRKWASNSKYLMRNISEQLIEPQMVKLSDNQNFSLKVLGIIWNPIDDTFTYNVNLSDDSSPTKRKILSDSASIFDPLGWAAPVLIRIKIMFQMLWIQKLHWDEELPSSLQEKWFEFRNDLRLLTELKISRWLPTYRQKFELHAFCDASENAYSAVVYVRSFVNDLPSCNIVAAKTRVAPLKQISLPRLELSGALLLSKLVKSISSSLQYFDFEIFAWTDSTIILSWFSDFPRSWKTFVANRCSEILEIIPRSHWHHIKGSKNPADCASRGISSRELIDHNLWWHGPEFLQDAHYDIHANQKDLPSQNADEIQAERRTTTIASLNITTFIDSNGLFYRFSSWNKLIRITSRILRFVNNTTKRKPSSQLSLSTTELFEARMCLFKLAQLESFPDEVSSLSSKGKIKMSSRILSLTPFIDDHGVLRVGGRIQNSLLSENQKHPIILTSKHPVSSLIITESHRKYMHAGTNFIMAQIKQNYWILGARNLVRKIVRSCTVCRRHSTDTSNQIMANLPSCRVQPARPFLKVGVDFAGPITLKTHRGRNAKHEKGYIAVYICMVTRAIHLEAVSDLSTDAFMASYKRFCGRRGIPSDIYSDNATNFVGAKRTLEEVPNFTTFQHDQIFDKLASNGTTWHFIPPAAPNFGGIWEAGVKSTKHHLKRVISNHFLTFEELSTLLAQIEAILNSRPICLSSTDDIDPLTPSHFLIGQALTLIPEPNLEDLNISRLSRWQLIQSLMQGFWKRWHTEYLTTQQQRVKWRKEQSNLQPGDIVIVKEPNMPPGKWCLGLIQECCKGDDGHTRVVVLRCKGATIKRPISKLIKLFTQ